MYIKSDVQKQYVDNKRTFVQRGVRNRLVFCTFRVAAHDAENVRIDAAYHKDQDQRRLSNLVAYCDIATHIAK